MKRIVIYALPIVLCFIVGWMGMLFQSEALVEWYPYLAKSSASPPNIAFPIAWTILYICMGLSLGRILDLGHNRFVGLWFLQLALNFIWSIAFFYMQSPIAGLVVIILLDVSVLSYSLLTWNDSKFASIIMIPYMIWLGFATFLNFYIWLFN